VNSSCHAYWTGPGGIGDYAQSNGNVHETVNTAHGLRDGHWRDTASHIRSEQSFDLIVIGAGLSGLMATHEFVKQRGPKSGVLVLDNHPIFGGEAMSYCLT
jgi:spermidine dehydrogenase